MIIRKDAVILPVPEAEDHFLRRAAIARVGLKRHNNRVDSGHSDAELNYRGLRGEWAVSTFLGLPFDWDGAARQGNPGRANFIYRGLTVDVKYTSKQAPPVWLFYGTPEEEGRDAFTADVAVLVMPAPGAGDVQIVGWTTREQFRGHCHVGHLPGRGGDRYYLRSGELGPMATLRTYHPLDIKQEAML